jgi:transcriptional regulator of acetoin/glycerol metabolism
MPKTGWPRPEIEASWRRSTLYGVKPSIDAVSVASEPFVDRDEELRQSVEVVLDSLVDDLTGTMSSLILADHRPVVIDRRATSAQLLGAMDGLGIIPGLPCSEDRLGTNAIGTAAEERRLVRVAGSDHFADAFKHLSCFGVPLVNPTTRRLVGVLDLTFPPVDEHPAMRALLAEAARRIQDLLRDRSSVRARAQFECFMSFGRTGRRAVISVLDDAVLLNRWARALDPVDQAALEHLATDPDLREHGAVVEVPLASHDRVPVRIHTQDGNVSFPGAILEVLSPAAPRRRLVPIATLPGLVGQSAAWKTFSADVARIAKRDAPLLLMGEPGVGKLSVAEALHRLSNRAGFAVLDARIEVEGAWLKQALELIRKPSGTVVLRHLEHCDAALVPVLVELERKSPGSFVVGTFTADLSRPPRRELLDRFRRVDVPPLADRREDIPALVAEFMTRHGAPPAFGLSPEALAVLRAAEFPGNLRQLENLVVELISGSTSGQLRAEDLPAWTRKTPVHLTPIERVERDAIVRALRAAGGNKAAAASELGISRATLYRKLHSYRIED